MGRPMVGRAVEDVWKRFCGFLDLTPTDFAEIQTGLLREQLSLVARSPLPRRLLPKAMPLEPEEFRHHVPLTTYEDYAPLLLERKEEALPERPELWAYTTRSGERHKWVPFTARAHDRLVDTMVGAVLLACARERGELALAPGAKILYSMAPRPYLSGFMPVGIRERTGWQAIPPPEVAEALGFQEAVKHGFRTALRTGVDVVSALTSVLMRMGQAYAEHGGRTGPSAELLHPAALFRLGRGYLRSRLQGRPLLPKDLWPARAILGWGEDTSFYRQRVAYYWGQEPYEFFGTTESGIIALESWARRGLVFTPFLAFLEFLPNVERGAIGSGKNGGEPPPTVSLDQVRAGETYELIFTSFYGMPFMRYRSGYLLKVLASEDRKSGVRLPHFAVAGRADSIIDLGGFTRLDEGLLTQAIHRAGLQCEGWVARKEYSQDGPQIHMYLGLARPLPEGEVLEALHQALLALDNPYRSLVELLKARPLAVTLLAPEGFRRYAKGGGPGETGKACSWVNPPEAVVEGLLLRG